MIRPSVILIVLNFEGPSMSLERSKEHLIQISIDIRWNRWSVKDSFSWDISNLDNSPEEFACQMVDDLQLPRVF